MNRRFLRVLNNLHVLKKNVYIRLVQRRESRACSHKGSLRRIGEATEDRLIRELRI